MWVISGEDPILHSRFHLDEDSQRGETSTGEGQKEGASCHKSEPGRASEQPQRAQSVAAHASYRGGEVWSGDASLQQTSVLGLGDGCATRLEGNANKIRDAKADGGEGRPGSGESSLGVTSHPQSNGESPATRPPQTTTRSWHLNSQGDGCSPEKRSFKTQFCSTVLKKSSGVSPCVARSRKSGTLASKVSWLIGDAEGLFWIFSTALQHVRKEGPRLVWPRWSSHVLPLLRERNIIPETELISAIKANIFTLFKESKIVSVVKAPPLLQTLVVSRRTFSSGQMFTICQHYTNPSVRNPPSLTPAQGNTENEEMPSDVSLNSKDVATNGDFPTPHRQNMAGFDDQMIITDLQVPDSGVPGICFVRTDEDPRVESAQSVEAFQNGQQTLMEFPDSLLSLRILSLADLMDTLQPVIPTLLFSSQRTVAV